MVLSLPSVLVLLLPYGLLVVLLQGLLLVVAVGLLALAPPALCNTRRTAASCSRQGRNSHPAVPSAAANALPIAVAGTTAMGSVCAELSNGLAGP